MNKLLVAGKFLDQPRLINNLTQKVPAALVAGGVVHTFLQVQKAPETEKKNALIKNASVWGVTIPVALLSPKFAPKFAKGISKLFTKAKHSCNEACQHVHEHAHAHKHEHANEHGHSHEHGHGDSFNPEEMSELIDNFLSNNKVSQEVEKALEKSKKRILMPSEIETVYTELKKDKHGEEFLREFIPDPEKIDSGHIFGEISRLSLMGAFTVMGGIVGGVLGDRLTNQKLKETVPNKIKEGSYQFLANIFLCNIGAGAALLLMEGAAKKMEKYKKEGIPDNIFSKFNYNLIDKLNPQSKITRAITMTGGIILTGIVLGSAIANVIGKKIIDPLLGRKTPGNYNLGHHHGLKHDIYSERTPEMLDVGLHVDDIATVAVLSGLKWIEPSLPVLYSISGYRAGIGYRNGEA